MRSPDMIYEPVQPQDEEDTPPPAPPHQNSLPPPKIQQRKTSLPPSQRSEEQAAQKKVPVQRESPDQAQELAASGETEHIYEHILPDSKDKPNEYTRLSSLPTYSLPDDMESLADLSVDYLANVDPREAQLWMLVQMQKMIQRIENVYETVGYYTRPQPVPPQQGNTSVSKSENPSSRKKHYVKLSEISKVVAQSDMPPKSCKDQESPGKESEADTAKSCVHPPPEKSSLSKFQLPHPYSMLKGNEDASTSIGQIQEQKHSAQKEVLIGKITDIFCSENALTRVLTTFAIDNLRAGNKVLSSGARIEDQ